MKIHGLQKLTLLDYPGRVACTVFTGGCNLRCPFCHNASLVTHIDEAAVMPEEEFFAFLKKRQGILDGVCITGGEPLMNADIEDFIKKIRALGFAVKLDTNGTFFETLSRIVKDKLVDYIAMDIKNTVEKYPVTTGVGAKITENVKKSVELLKNSDIPFEFRTTIVSEFHAVEDIEKITEWIGGENINYFLQNFVDSGDTIEKELHSCDKSTLSAMLETAKKNCPKAQLRGI